MITNISGLVKKMTIIHKSSQTFCVIKLTRNKFTTVLLLNNGGLYILWRTLCLIIIIEVRKLMGIFFLNTIRHESYISHLQNEVDKSSKSNRFVPFSPQEC